MNPVEQGSAGRLKIILGYAAGVGKTYKMLDEGRKLQQEGHDVVIGYFEPHGRQDTIAKTEGMEIVPRKTIEYRGIRLEEMDTEAILARKPAICLVDEFPHTNVPGSERAKRWEDVFVLLDAGIDVMTTMNIQHLESLNDRMREITGIQVRETIPDWVVKRADEIVLVDLTPGALLNRLARGVVYAPEKARLARENFFKESNLAALREMALRQVAHEVDIRQLQSTESRERLLLYITESPTSAALIRRGRRVADYLKADCFAVSVQPEGAKPSQALDHHLDFARKLHIDTRILESEAPAQALVDFAHRNSVTQIFLPKPPSAALPLLAKRNVVMQVVRLAKDLQVIVVADRRK